MPGIKLRRQREAYRRGAGRTLALAGVIFALMGWLLYSLNGAARKARRQSRRARDTASKLESAVYFARINVLQHLWENARVGRMTEILEETRSYPRRGFEWGYWYRLTHQAKVTFTGHTYWPLLLAFSPDGRRVVSAGMDQVSRVWDPDTGRELLTLRPEHPASVNSVAWSPDGRRIATGGNDRIARVWDAATGEDLGHAKRPAARNTPWPHKPALVRGVLPGWAPDRHGR